MKIKSLEILIVLVVLLALALLASFEFDCKDKIEAFEQVHQWGWGKIPRQNLCPHCGESSYTRFCKECKKERGNLPYIGVYCPVCDTDGKYPSQTDDVTEICGDCGAEKTWKYVYKDWQSEPEPNEPNLIDRTIYLWESEKIMKHSLTFPTWPEYIELDKDLVIDNTNVSGLWPQKRTIIYKGTKIYYKEDD